jgi:hypothetical protein
VIIESNVFEDINVLFVNGKLLVNEEAKPSIDKRIGGRMSIIIDIPTRELNMT